MTKLPLKYNNGKTGLKGMIFDKLELLSKFVRINLLEKFLL